jgi:hypothetical protein
MSHKICGFAGSSGPVARHIGQLGGRFKPLNGLQKTGGLLRNAGSALAQGINRDQEGVIFGKSKAGQPIDAFKIPGLSAVPII